MLNIEPVGTCGIAAEAHMQGSVTSRKPFGYQMAKSKSDSEFARWYIDA